jgi:two-component system cell cycle sensor histidine kinase/response regulator CckA
MNDKPDRNDLRHRVAELEAEAARLGESERTLRTLLENIPAIVYTAALDEASTTTYVNPMFEAWLGYTADEWNADPDLWRKCLHPDDAQRVMDEVHRIQEAGEPLRIEYRMLARDGRVVWLRDEANIARDARGRPIHLAGALLNITDRKAAEAALSEREELFREMADNIHEIFWLMDWKGQRMMYASPAFERLTGRKVVDLMKRFDAWLDVVHADDRNAAIESLQRVIASGEEEEQEYRILRPDGTVRSILNRGFAIRDGTGKVVRIAGIAQDVTEKKKLEEQLRRSQKLEAIGTLAGGIAHDFNNLLMGIIGNTSIMAMDIDESHPHRKNLRSIEACVRNGANLTRQILEFARGGRYEVLASDMTEIVRASAEMFGRTRKEIVIHTRFLPDLWVVEVDRSQIGQVLINLFVNAWQAMPGGGELYLETANAQLDDHAVAPHAVPPGRYVKVSVTDNGVGMDDATRARIFDPFFTTKELGRGTGLGLASAYGIVKSHGGFITVYSEPGRGSTFNVYLPASEKQAALEPDRPSAVPGGTETILVVDDEEVVLSVGRQMLEKIGYGVLTARNGPEALDLFARRGGEIGLVVLDMILPGEESGSVFDRLRAQNSRLKVLLASGYSINGHARAILDRGCRGFIQKPFSLVELARKIREILDAADEA